MMFKKCEIIYKSFNNIMVVKAGFIFLNTLHTQYNIVKTHLNKQQVNS